MNSEYQIPPPTPPPPSRPSYTEFSEILSICSQDIERKWNYDGQTNVHMEWRAHFFKVGLSKQSV